MNYFNQLNLYAGVVIVLLFNTACEDENLENMERELGIVCDTIDVSFSDDVQTIFDEVGCVNCHNPQAPSGDILLHNIGGVREAGESGQLVGAVAHEEGYAPMPDGMPQLPDCDIAKIRAWVNQGMKDN